MAVSIDAVYQKVLALANKEQRGYITPQEFNLFADLAQMEIFEQYFYDLDQFSRVPGTDLPYADKIKNLREKTDLFQTYTPSRVEVSAGGWMKLYDHAPLAKPGGYGGDLYRLGLISVRYGSQGFAKGIEAQHATREELNVYQNSKLLKRSGNTARYDAPTYSLFSADGIMRIQIHPAPALSYIDNDYTGTNVTYTNDDDEKRVYPDPIQIFYTRKPKKPSWGYTVVNDKPLHNLTFSTDFELHASEESELVYRILAFAGIALQKPQLTQVAGTLEQAKVQQEKQ